MLDTVTFDVWNTLLVNEYQDDRLKNARIEHVLSALKDSGLRLCREDVANAYEYSEACLAGFWKQERDAGLEGHLALLLEGLDLEADEHLKDVIRKPYAEALLDYRPKLIDGADDLLAALKRKGYRIGLISNTGRTPGSTMKLILDDYGILQYFDWMAFSNEVGYIKPSPRIFERALFGLGSSASSTVHVGDNMLLDVYGAKAAGMKAVLFNKYSERFELYAARYYDANGRHESPDATVERLADVEAALDRLG